MGVTLGPQKVVDQARLAVSQYPTPQFITLYVLYSIGIYLQFFGNLIYSRLCTRCARAILRLKNWAHLCSAKIMGDGPLPKFKSQCHSLVQIRNEMRVQRPEDYVTAPTGL